MGYRRLDINLLPPELQPGPVVRYAVVINTILIGVTVAFLIVDSFLSFTMMASLRRDVELKEDLIEAKAGVVSDYDDLVSIEDHVNSIGRLIALASSEYVDLPVILDHLTRVLPDGVYVDSVSTQSNTVGSSIVGLDINLATGLKDPQLVVRTLNVLKGDPMMGECIMRMAAPNQSDLGPVLEAAGVDWIASGPDLASFSAIDHFEFQIQTTISAPVSTEGLSITYDNIDNMDVLSLAEKELSYQVIQDTPMSNTPKGVSVLEAK